MERRELINKAIDLGRRVEELQDAIKDKKILLKKLKDEETPANIVIEGDGFPLSHRNTQALITSLHSDIDELNKEIDKTLEAAL